MGGGLPRRVPAQAVPARAGRGVRGRSRRHRRRGVGVSLGGHRADGRELRRRRRSDQRARGIRRRDRARGGHCGRRRRATLRVDRRAQGAQGQRQHRCRGCVDGRRGAGRAGRRPPDRRRGGRCGGRPADRGRHGYRKHHGRNGIDRRADRRPNRSWWSAGAPASTTLDGRARWRRFATRCTAAAG